MARAASGRVRLAEIVLPAFGEAAVEPVVPPETYEARLAAARSAAERAGLDALVVYGDREHFAGLQWLTGFDPRFEEALLILVPGRRPGLVVGNEGWTYAGLAAVDLDRVLYQSFSLPGQPRDRGARLGDILLDRGLRAGRRIGVVGWKVFDRRDAPAPETWIEAPSFLVDALRRIAGESGAVVNATGLLIDPVAGLRVVNDVDQLARFEFASCHTSEAIRRMLFGLAPGMTELEAAESLRMNGLPLSCHPVLTAGPRAFAGLASPTSRPIGRAEPFICAYGVWGALNARAGWTVEDAGEMPKPVRDYVERLVAPYFAAIVEWYETVGIGVTGAELFEVIDRHLGDPFFGVTLNPGHLLGMDEWTNSPIFRGSREPLRSGMALQVDVIPATQSPWFTTNVEDGIALADEALRAAFAERYPDAWGRILSRRAFMEDTLGIRLAPEVLPFSNIPAYLPPFLLRPDRAMTAR